MKLESLDIQRLPGIHPGFRLEALGPGVNVVVGPNASGKSSLLRGLRAALYPQEQRNRGVQVAARFNDAQGSLEAQRVGTDLYWLRDGQRGDPPPLPDHRFIDCYTLHIEDLLAADHATERAIGDWLARELAGGYDLPALRADPALALKTTHARSEAQALATAEQELRQRTREQRALQEDEQRLAELETQRQDAQRASDAAAQYERALELLEARRERQSLETRLAAFPEGLARLRGDELDSLEQLRETLRRLDHERQQAQARLDTARDQLDTSGLSDSPLEAAAFDDPRARVRELQGLESRADQAARELQSARSAVASAADALGADPAAVPTLDPTAVHTTEQALETQRQLQAAIRRREDELAGLPAADPDRPDPEALRRARDELLHWLGAPRPPANSVLHRAARITALAAAAAAIGSAALWVHWGFLVLALPVAWSGWILARPNHDAVPRQAAEARYRDTGIEPPSAWTPEAVRERLEAVERELRAAEADRHAAERRTRLERELEEKHDALAAAREQLRQTAAAVGFDPECLDASLQRWIHLSAELDRARRDEATARGEQEQLTARMDKRRTALVRFLDAYAAAPEDAQPTADALAQRLERLARRLQDRDEARREQHEAQRELERLEVEADTTRARVTKLYARAGLEEDDEAGLREHLRLRPEWQRLQDELRDVRAREGDRSRHLEAQPDLLALVDQDAEAALREALAEREHQAQQRDELTREMTRIETEIDRAGRDRALETARARWAQARDALDTRLDEALFATAGRFLLDQVTIEHEETAQPAALRRARDWFQRFTRHQYELLFSPGDTATPFGARETASGNTRSLSELSSGTRMQLVLAVRIAFALEAERGRTPLPLFLDEALGTADPERFRAVAESLQLLAQEDDRQVFYLTAQPEDARYWSARDATVRIIDLPAVRGAQHAITDAGDLALPEPRAIPSPGDARPEDYATTLGVPAIDPWQDAARIHPFHLLRDDLDALHRLLTLGVDSIGTLETVLRGPDAELLGDPAQREQLAARVEGARAWLRAWRQGRGRPVDRAALEGSGVISDTFIEAVSELATQVDGDAEALVRELEQGAVKRFQSATRERLEAWLGEHGYIDPEPTNSDTTLEHRVIATLQPFSPSPDAATRDGQALAHSLQAGLRSN
ncbi:AAA family ATPase [Thioalkalivibrio sp. ALE16]|uniref:ATP-binding protein n=1 Tax=Thioalkalivibrio sp. ALE16 TaxID=1158172 RepID=UPI000362DF60|nr:AAA family ATPase [Thioalkalivibrio sp. ALE16]